MNLKLWHVVVAGMVLITFTWTGAYYYGGYHQKKVKTFSELLERTQGRRGYIMDTEIRCSNGKDIGRFILDIDMNTGKTFIVRNDPKNLPNCTVDSVPLVQQPVQPTPTVPNAK